MEKENTTYVLRKIDVAQCFDELSILEVKKSKSTDSERANSLESQIILLKQDIDKAIGSDLLEKIYHSEFYMHLFSTNLIIFESVDKLKETELPRLTMKRFYAKRDIQKHFFGKTLNEIKV